MASPSLPLHTASAPASAPFACPSRLPLLSLLAPFKARFDPILFVANNFIRRSCAQLQLHLLLLHCCCSSGSCCRVASAIIQTMCATFGTSSRKPQVQMLVGCSHAHTHLELATNCNTSAYTLATHLPHTHTCGIDIGAPQRERGSLSLSANVAQTKASSRECRQECVLCACVCCACVCVCCVY